MDTAKTAHPLCWPLSKPRSKHRSTNNQFKTSFASGRDNCLREIKRLGGSSVIISTNVPVKKDGTPYGVKWGDSLAGEDPGVSVYFMRGGRELCFACDRWNHVQDNMHAIALTIKALRGIARWGTGDMMESAFRGYAALPERSESSEWWKTLGVPINSHRITVREAYVSLVKKHHPDSGGDAELFARVQRAWEEYERQNQSAA